MRFKQGVVIGTKMAKTVKVLIERVKAHPKYKKRFKAFTKLYAHNENTDIKLGDKVMVMEVKPISKLKRWKVISEQEKTQLVKDNEKQGAKIVSNRKEFTIEYKKRKKKVRREEAPKAPEAVAKSAEAAPAPVRAQDLAPQPDATPQPEAVPPTEAK